MGEGSLGEFSAGSEEWNINFVMYVMLRITFYCQCSLPISVAQTSTLKWNQQHLSSEHLNNNALVPICYQKTADTHKTGANNTKRQNCSTYSSGRSRTARDLAAENRAPDCSRCSRQCHDCQQSHHYSNLCNIHRHLTLTSRAQYPKMASSTTLEQSAATLQIAWTTLKLIRAVAECF